MRKFLVLALILLSCQLFAQSGFTLTSRSGNTFNYSASYTNQAYYWTVTTGGAIAPPCDTCTGVTVTVSNGCPIICLTTFKNGSCTTTCDTIRVYHIEEDPLQICMSATSTNFKKRGKYFLYDCSENPKQADWTVAEGISNFTVGGSSTNVAIFTITPKYQWMIGTHFTVQAFEPGTSTLLASYSIVVQDCDVCSTCRTAGDGKPATATYMPGVKRLVYTTSFSGLVNIELIDPNTGSVAAIWRNVQMQQGRNAFFLNNAKLQKDKIYVVRLTADGQESITIKIVY